MQHYDRTTITEQPIPDPCGDTRCDECNVGGCPGIIDADQDQRDQLTTRLSLRREK